MVDWKDYVRGDFTAEDNKMYLVVENGRLNLIIGPVPNSSHRGMRHWRHVTQYRGPVELPQRKESK